MHLQPAVSLLRPAERVLKRPIFYLAAYIDNNAGFLEQISLSLESMNWHLKSGQTCLCDVRANGFLSWKPVLLPFIKYYFISMFPLNKFKRLNCLVEVSFFSDFFFKKDTFLLVDVMFATCKGKTVNRHKIRLFFNVQPLTNMWVEL